MRYGLIAGGGSFPLLTLRAAREAGHEMTVVAVKEEAPPEIAELADSCHWVSLGQLSKVIEVFRAAGVSQAVMAGRIQHKQIYSAIRPDWRLVKVLNNLRRKNTDSLLGAVTRVLEDEGISILDSTFFLSRSMAHEGANGRRKPSPAEFKDIEYGREVAGGPGWPRHWPERGDLRTSLRGCGGDGGHRRCAAARRRTGEQEKAHVGQGPAKPAQDMRFDVPVIGPRTIRKMREVNATAVAVASGRTLLLEKDELLREADRAGIAVVGFG